MIFSSLTFVWFFLPALAFVYYLVPGRNGKNGILLAASLLFYSWGEPKYVVLVILSVLMNYGFGLAIERAGIRKAQGRPVGKKLVFAVSILANLALLGYFKYFNFFLELAYTVLGKEGFAPRDIALPIGISFYTFQCISYLSDTYKGENPAQRNLLHLALYISLFPQILSGPIVKYHELEPQIMGRRESLSMHAYGIKRFVYGLGKKMVFANMFGQTADRIFELPPHQLGTVTVWLGLILYSFQIYYDFAGYSDMAIGLGRMFGFTYRENFNYPYLSTSVSEFWRRWHISLSTWFKEYLYIPLGGNRKGLIRTCVNLFIVFLATGLWHGASMNFILWGIYYGILLVTERFWLGKILEKNPVKWLNRLYTLAAVAVGWLFFRVESVSKGLVLLKAMVIPTAGGWNARIFANNRILFLLVLAVLFCGPLQQMFPGLKARLFDEDQVKASDIAVMLVLLILGTILMVSSTYQAFIYFKF